MEHTLYISHYTTMFVGYIQTSTKHWSLPWHNTRVPPNKHLFVVFLFYISLYHRDCFMVFSSFSHRDAVVNSPLHVPEQTSTGSKGRRQPQHPRHQQASACPVVKWLWRFLICDLKTWDNQTWGFIVDIIDFRWPWEIGFWRIWGESTVIIWIFLIINVSRWVFNL